MTVYLPVMATDDGLSKGTLKIGPKISSRGPIEPTLVSQFVSEPQPEVTSWFCQSSQKYLCAVVCDTDECVGMVRGVTAGLFREKRELVELLNAMNQRVQAEEHPANKVLRKVASSGGERSVELLNKVQPSPHSSPPASLRGTLPQLLWALRPTDPVHLRTDRRVDGGEGTCQTVEPGPALPTLISTASGLEPANDVGTCGAHRNVCGCSLELPYYGPMFNHAPTAEPSLLRTDGVVSSRRARGGRREWGDGTGRQ